MRYTQAVSWSDAIKSGLQSARSRVTRLWSLFALRWTMGKCEGGVSLALALMMNVRVVPSIKTIVGMHLAFFLWVRLLRQQTAEYLTLS